MDKMTFDSSLTSIKGVGEKTAGAFARLGIHNVGELLRYYPRNYITYEAPVCVSELSEGYRQSVCVYISGRPEVRKVRKMTITAVYARDHTGTIKLTWFNCPFLRNYFHAGDKYVFVGEVSRKGGTLTITQPEYYAEEKYGKLLDVWQPVYTVTAGLTSKAISKAVKNSSEAACQIDDYLPPKVLDRYGLMGIREAVSDVHFPPNEEKLKAAISRIAFDEFYAFIYNMHRLREDSINISNSCVIDCDDKALRFIEGLPYKLTSAQMSAVSDMLEDMAGENVMNRLVQGDVGSGKTIVAAIGLFAAAVCGYQGVIMAPTEVLATQHYKELSSLFEPYGITVGLLTGSMPAKEKRTMQEAIREHRVSVIVGTHALIQDRVHYDRLGLVVTDEQHRFGVRQREKLADKGETPHVLVMSATPIPRTLAIIMYGDLDISVIDELPAGRLPIKNCVVDESWRQNARAFIVKEVGKGHQVYIVCPMVEASEALSDVANVTEYTEELRAALEKDYGCVAPVACLHGRMRSDEKNGILEDFVRGDISILVSTTVIEVGINNPNATVMMIENAERFGLAQLHQLRGRVGRGSNQSYCIFMSGKRDKESMERLRVLEKSNDGFFIASEDLRLRGPGDFFGIRQSGENMFNMGDIYNHADMLKAAQEVYATYGREIDISHKWGSVSQTFGAPVL